ncbi:MAG TPA: hypothetical protein VH165_36240 [Kofleriaceae bacterium]|nr:hypothetical protein [Kofleriaceae bacterium]
MDEQRTRGQRAGAGKRPGGRDQPARRAVDQVAGPERREQLCRDRDGHVELQPGRAGGEHGGGEQRDARVLGGLPAPVAGDGGAPRGAHQDDGARRRGDQRAVRRQPGRKALEIVVGERVRVVVQVHRAQRVARGRHRDAGHRERELVGPPRQAERAVREFVGQHEQSEVEREHGEQPEHQREAGPGDQVGQRPGVRRSRSGRARREDDGDQERQRAGDPDQVMSERGAMDHAGSLCESDAAADSQDLPRVTPGGVHGVDGVAAHAVDMRRARRGARAHDSRS